MKVQTKVAAYMDEMGIKKTRVAQKTGIRLSRLSQILNNHTEMRADELDSICGALKVSPTKFIENTTE